MAAADKNLPALNTNNQKTYCRNNGNPFEAVTQLRTNEQDSIWTVTTGG